MLKQFLRDSGSQSGYTIMELLVSSAIGLIVLSMSLSAVLANRNVYKRDVVSTRINENLRSAIDIIGMNVRQAGEALDSSFPAIEVIDGASGAPDTLVLRRNLFENEVLNVCQALTAGASNTSILFAFNTASSACDYDSALAPYVTTWNTYITSKGGVTRAYVHNRSSRQGEFFETDGTVDDAAGTQMYVQRVSGSWTNSYPGDGNSAAMYLLDEYRFSLSGGVLQLVENADTTNTLNVVDGVTDFQIRARMQDGTTATSFAATDDWTEILSLEISLSGTDTFSGRDISSAVTARLFPRNILSH